MGNITINNTKGIKKLDFELPQKGKVYLLVGPNGVGKSTLLVCLARMCDSYAFAYGFYSSKNVQGLDHYDGAAITYTNAAGTITFRKGGSRWVATPKSMTYTVLEAFGFEDSIFIQADHGRIQPTQEEIRDGYPIAADPQTIAALNQIFETTRFNTLSKLHVSNGRGRRASDFYILENHTPSGRKRDRFSEKRFSSGELAIVRLVDSLKDAAAGSLILLDEAEMALHPRIQKNLLTYIQQETASKSLTVFISTHSSTLINSVSKDSIILLQNDGNGNCAAITPCYPAKAIGSVDFEVGNKFDHLFFVEDEIAQQILQQMVQRYMKLVPEHASASICITPVGGYAETARFTIRTKDRVFSNSSVFAVLDDDAFHGVRDPEPPNPHFADLYRQYHKVIKNLGFTPEVWLIEQIEQADQALKSVFRSAFHCEHHNAIADHAYLSCKANKPRKKAKQKFDALIEFLHRHTGDSHEIVCRNLIGIIVDQMPEGKIKETIVPLFREQ